jgi:hypothetical protein
MWKQDLEEEWSGLSDEEELEEVLEEETMSKIKQDCCPFNKGYSRCLPECVSISSSS